MRELTKSQVAALREQYPAGSRIRLIQMNDPYHPVPPGAEGTLAAIDDLGTFHVGWDNGRGLGLVPGEDQFEVTPLETLKLYMPLNAVTYEEAEWADLDQEGIQLDGRDLLPHKEAINRALRDNDLPAEKARGLMHWYDERDGVKTNEESEKTKRPASPQPFSEGHGTGPGEKPAGSSLSRRDPAHPEISQPTGA